MSYRALAFFRQISNALNSNCFFKTSVVNRPVETKKNKIKCKLLGSTKKEQEPI